MDGEESSIEQLAREQGLIPEFEDIVGQRHMLSRDDRLSLLRAMGLAVRQERDCELESEVLERRRQACILDPVVVFEHTAGRVELSLRVPGHLSPAAWTVELTLEGQPTQLTHFASMKEGETNWNEGRAIRVYRVVVEHEFPPGYHQLRVYPEGSLQIEGLGQTLLIACPAACYERPEWKDRKVRGLSVQLYALHHKGGSGSGELDDLLRMAPWLRAKGFELVQVNPIHATYPANPGHASPYSPSSRYFLNPFYVHVPSVPEWKRLAAGEQDRILESLRPAPSASEFIDHRAIGQARLAAFRRLFQEFENHEVKARTARFAAFQEYCHHKGALLERQALHDALFEHFASAEEPIFGWQQWPPPYRHPDAPAVQSFAAANRREILFYRYLYFVAAQEFERVRQGLAAEGIVLNLDLAVGVDRGSADVWGDRELYAVGAQVGAPPDPFAPQGQAWGLAPMLPSELRRRAFRPWIELLDRNMPAGGVLRLDHIMQLFRLYWVTDDGHGGYVGYPAREMLGILALESHRRSAMVIGEDLGTVPPGIREDLARRKVLSWRVVYFEKHADGNYKRPDEYPYLSIASVNTHDLPTIRGFLSANDIQLRENLGILAGPPGRSEREQRAREVERLGALLSEMGLLEDASDPDQWIEGLHAFIEQCGSQLRLLSLHDVLKEAGQPNLPGTVHEYPNWSLRYSRPIEEFPT